VDDKAPFTLWDAAAMGFRLPTTEEKGWLMTTYKSACIIIHYPRIIFQTDDPPDPVPVTVAGVSALFVPPGFEVPELRASSNYASPRVTALLPELDLSGWHKRPSREELIQVIEALRTVADVIAINVVGVFMYVELRWGDGKRHGRYSLPGRVAGLSTTYWHHDEPMWPTLTRLADTRLIDPRDDIQDTSDYLALRGTLTPGARLKSSLTTSSGQYASLSRATTAGVLLRDSGGNVRLTAANHGFLDSDEVFHPTHTGRRIGEIDERWEAQDVALVRLDPSINFSNAAYFDAVPPKRLMRAIEIVPGTWYGVDGMSTGIVWLQAVGVRLEEPPRPVGIKTHFTKWKEESVLYSHGPTGGKAKEGLCGAPLVSEDPELALVAGFFHLANGYVCLSGVLDEIIDRGWAIV
jgi:hypothetical protein